MLIFCTVSGGIIFGVLLILRIIRIRKDRLERKKIMEQRLEQLIHSNKKTPQK